MANIEALKEELSKEFGQSVAFDGKVMQECISLCQLYNLTAKDLLWKWEAIKFGHRSTLSEISTFDMDCVVAIKAQLSRDLLKESTRRKQQAVTSQSFVVSANLNRARFLVGSTKPVIAQVKAETNDAPMHGPSSVSYRGPKPRKKHASRYMYEKVSERSEVLDDRIDQLAELIRDHYNVAELGDPSSSTDDDITVVGRITQDIEASGSSNKLDETTICLESSRMLGSGSRVPLRFDPAVKIRGCAKGSGSVGLFPGAIVALKGKNGGGGWFQVSEILSLPPPRPTPSVGLSAMKIDSDMANAPFSMTIACGPYTLDTDLLYKPAQLLFENIKNTKPNIVLLMGPFVDASHPRIKMGDCDNPPFKMYQARFLKPLTTFLKASPGSMVLLLPSIRDLLSDHAVYPQSEYPEWLTGDNPGIRRLPNPARFMINGVTFASTSTDVPFHLRKEEFVKRGEEVDPIVPKSEEDTGTDVMGNLCRHLLQQRSFYPLFPVPKDVCHEVNLDISHSYDLQMCDAENQYAPDVLIMPSKLKEFSKMVHTTRAINPSYTSKLRYTTLQVTGGERPVMDRIMVHLSKLENADNNAS